MRYCFSSRFSGEFISVWSIAAAQSGSRPGEIEWNISHHLDFIQQAARHRVDVLILPDGTKLAYSKRKLFGEENLFFQPGEDAPLFGSQQHYVALAICADISVEEYAREAAHRGADLYATAVLVSEKSYQNNCRYLARWSKEYKMAVLMANHALPTGGYQSAGKSAFWDENGRQVIGGSAGEQLVIARHTGKDWQGEVYSLR